MFAFKTKKIHVLALALSSLASPLLLAQAEESDVTNLSEEYGIRVLNHLKNFDLVCTSEDGYTLWIDVGESSRLATPWEDPELAETFGGVGIVYNTQMSAAQPRCRDCFSLDMLALKERGGEVVPLYRVDVTTTKLNPNVKVTDLADLTVRESPCKVLVQ